MKIDQITKGTKGNLARISARVTWEDCDRQTQEIYISVPSRFRDDLSCNPNTFLLNGFVPAMHDGEKRLQIEGKLCPQLRTGVETAIQLLQHWYGEDGHSTRERSIPGECTLSSTPITAARKCRFTTRIAI